jgi:two-component system cell cycle sensor histidine kinase PleC
MLKGSPESSRSASLINEYSSLLGDAILRHRTRVAEHSARIEVELANRVKSEFIATMSHELRTPLNTIIGFSKLLSEHDRRRLQDSEVVQYSHLIHDAAGHLLSVINDILDISKIQSGRYTLDAREINIDEVIQATVASFKLSVEETGVNVEVRLDPEIQPVRGDAIKIRQVLTNLIGNAIKFTRSGGTITVEAMRLSDDSSVIRVRDTGIGMTEEEIRVALTPFGQVDGSRTRWREGTGLGLPIAKALVELHGGRLSIRSSKETGTEVSAILPSRHRVSVAQIRDSVFGVSTSEPHFDTGPAT